MSKPTVSIETITPAIAERMLRESNQNNRKMSVKRVEDLARQMKDGKFLLGPDAIAFDKKNRLYNGQHRLQACVDSGVAIEAIVLRESVEEAFMVTDIGLKKMGGHALHTMGYKDVTSLSAVARVVANIIYTGNPHDGWANLRSIPPNEIVATVEAYPNLEEIITTASKLTRTHDQLCTTRTTCAVALWYASQHGEYHNLLLFLEKVAAGVGLEDGSPEVALRRRLSNLHHAANSFGGYQSYREQMALIIKAYIMAKKGQKCHTLVWKDVEAFPTFE